MAVSEIITMNSTDWWICGRRCGWQGRDEDKYERSDTLHLSTFVCPDCGCDSFWREKPLFVPLKAQYFAQFADGTKTTEYRQRGPRWNAATCRVGRRVILSRGYGKGARLTGVIVGFHYDTIPSKIPGWLECYGPGAGDAACIGIELDPK